jgi:hypothetical protein
MTDIAITTKIQSNPDLQLKIRVLSLAEKMNPKFKNPHIQGGYLRDIVLDATPSDCDVVFDGYVKDQPGVLESVREAEKQLGVDHYPNWEFENFNASGVSGNFFDDTIGFYSNHTDYLTLMLCDAHGKVLYGSDKTLQCLHGRIYDIRYQGLMIWMGFRDRSYFRSTAGLACRGMYLCHKLNLNVSDLARELFTHFDYNYEKLTAEEKESLVSYWNKKTKNLADVQTTLDKFGVKKLQ